MSPLRRKLSNCCCCKKPWLLKTLSGTWKETRRKLFLTCMLEEVWRTLCRKHAVFVSILPRMTGYMFSRASHWLVTFFSALCTDWLNISPHFALTRYTFSRASHWPVLHRLVTRLVARFPALGDDWLFVFPRFSLGHMFSRALYFFFFRVSTCLMVSDVWARLHAFPCLAWVTLDRYY